MAAAAASGVSGIGVTLTARSKGDEGNLITAYAVKDPAGATGATTLVESGNVVYAKLKNDGADVTATIAEMVTAFGTSNIVSAALTAAATGANTGAAFTGTRLAGGTSGANGYDDLAALTGAGWRVTTITPEGGQGSAIDVAEKILNGRRVRISADASTGCTILCRAVYNTELKRARAGLTRLFKAIGATGAGEYVV